MDTDATNLFVFGASPLRIFDALAREAAEVFTVEIAREADYSSSRGGIFVASFVFFFFTSR